MVLANVFVPASAGQFGQCGNKCTAFGDVLGHSTLAMDKYAMGLALESNLLCHKAFCIFRKLGSLSNKEQCFSYVWCKYEQIKYLSCESFLSDLNLLCDTLKMSFSVLWKRMKNCPSSL